MYPTGKGENVIDITKLTDKDIGRWVIYTPSQELGEKLEKGKIKSWNDSGIFVVYDCAGNWMGDLWKEYTAQHTNPEDLEFAD